MLLGNRTMALTNPLDLHANGTITTRVNATIAVETLNVIKIEIEGNGHVGLRYGRQGSAEHKR
jgi:hypothetical protein